jgi:HAE1 family hydrophobic/amphiphilic exporter-1
MVPIALAKGKSDEISYFPMARAIAGGLAFSTMVSLLFLPTIYAMLDDLSNGVTRVFKRARGGGAPAAAVAAIEAE